MKKANQFNLSRFFIHVFFIINFALSQNLIYPNNHTMPKNRIIFQFNNFINKNTLSKSYNKSSTMSLSLNTNIALNNGHPNIDNQSEFYLAGSASKLNSLRFEYRKPWLFIEMEPYFSFHRKEKSVKTFDTWHSNNNYNLISNKELTSGLKQSQIILHYKGFGIGYGHINHWWGLGFHSAIALTSNSPSQETYAFGTFKDIQFGKFSFGSKVIVMPYNNHFDIPIYFSGMNSHLTFSSDPKITLGFFRTYLSGNFENLSEETNLTSGWNIVDATMLVIEPLFGQSKKGLPYSVPGTPGYDPWNEILVGYINLNFPEIFLDVYFELGSDDNRANLTDLRAHWDHTLGYLIGFKKYHMLGNKALLFGAEYLSLIKSNTEKFWRQYDYAYYTGSQYDYFTYKGRRMGGHSGSSSNDLIFLFGLGVPNQMILFTYNNEKHGLKNKTYPEVKREINITYNYKINDVHSLFLIFESEKINNYEYKVENISRSKYLWIGFSLTIL